MSGDDCFNQDQLDAMRGVPTVVKDYWKERCLKMQVERDEARKEVKQLQARLRIIYRDVRTIRAAVLAVVQAIDERARLAEIADMEREARIIEDAD